MTEHTYPIHVHEAINLAQALFKSQRYAVWRDAQAHQKDCDMHHKLMYKFAVMSGHAQYLTDEELLSEAIEEEEKAYKEASHMSDLHIKRGYNISGHELFRQARNHWWLIMAYAKALNDLKAYNKRSEAA